MIRVLVDMTNFYKPIHSLSDALDKVAEYNKQGIVASLSFLPVVKSARFLIRREIEEYNRILLAITRHKLNCDVTVKLHQLGIHRQDGLAEESMREIIEQAARFNNFVWIDMESKDSVDATVEIFRTVGRDYTNVGICLQAYLKRTERDLKLLGAHRAPIRLVKGFYNERDFNTWEEVTQNYFRLLPILLTQSSYPAIATHDEKIINEAKRIIREKNIANAEFQFFLGVRDDLARQLVLEGFKVRVYIPYGNFWRFLLKGLRTFDILHGLERFFRLRPR